MTKPTIHLHKDDLPGGLNLVGDIAVDTETTGLSHMRDRLCLLQLCDEEGSCHLVQFAKGQYVAPNLKALLGDTSREILFHYARFDVAVIARFLGVTCSPIYCTKIASKLVRTYTDRHGLKNLCSELIGVELSKQQQSSDWAAEELSPEQQHYAASDVLHLHALREKLNMMLEREGRMDIAKAAFQFLPVRAAMDLNGFEPMDIFAHS